MLKKNYSSDKIKEFVELYRLFIALGLSEHDAKVRLLNTIDLHYNAPKMIV